MSWIWALQDGVPVLNVLGQVVQMEDIKDHEHDAFGVAKEVFDGVEHLAVEGDILPARTEPFLGQLHKNNARHIGR